MGPQRQKSYEFGPFKLDLKEHLLSHAGNPIPLAPKAFDVLVRLIEQRGHLLQKDELIRDVWPDSFVEEGNLARTIWVLRKALDMHDKGQSYIETVPKLGYRFCAEVAEILVVDNEDSAVHKVESENGLITASNAESTPQSDKSDLNQWIGDLASSASSWRRYFLAAFAVLLVLAAGFGSVYLWQGVPASTKNQFQSLAVLPFENLSGDPSQEPFANGMTEDLNTELGKIDQLRVIDRPSTSKFKNTQESMAEIARKLNVDGVIKGASVRAGDRVRITITLYRGSDGQNLWSNTYERAYVDELSLQDAIAKAIADEIKIRLSPADLAALSRGQSVKPEALDAYLKGVEYFTGAQNFSNPEKRKALFLQAIDPLQQAIALEPEYLNAHEKLLHTFYYLAGPGDEQSLEYWQKTVDEARSILRLDDSNRQGHAVLGTYEFRYRWDRAEAQKEFERALERPLKSPDSGLASYALFLSSGGRQEEAIAAMKSAIENYPASTGMKMNIGNFYTREHEYDKAIEYLQQTAELNPDHAGVRNALSRALACKGSYPDAIAEAQKEIELRGGKESGSIHLAWIYARSRDQDSAMKIMNGVFEHNRPGDGTREAFDAAGVYAELGNKDEAFEWLERAYLAHAPSLIWLKTDPEMDKLRGDPRYDDLLRRIGLSP